jgi:hypothetical protein
MQNNYTPSGNIIRDADRNLNYKPTPNAQRAVDKIVNEFKIGKRSFNIIGSYGTGKSSFLWALQQSIKGNKPFFEVKYFQEAKSEIINLVGEYKSFANCLAEYFAVEGDNSNYKNIFAEIFQRYHALGKKRPLLLIVVDEFGKFLEYAAKNSPEQELYFLQQFAEFINNPDHNILLINTVHQNFDAYNAELSDTQKQEWKKVKGRFEEITFNEPVEQLIFLASEQISLSIDFQIDTKKIDTANDLFLKSNAFKISKEFRTSISKKIYPLDMLSAYTLALALQKYGQNERSLFSFLNTEDDTGLRLYDKRTNEFYNLSNIFDYLNFNYYSFLNSTSNTDFSAWMNLKDALEKLELYFEGDTLEQAQKIIKSLGLLNIFASKSAVLDRNFALQYAKVCIGFEASAILAKLEDKKLIFYRSYINRFIIFEGTDIDLPTVLIAAESLVDNITDISTLLKRYLDLSPVFAKKYYYEIGTPRIFEFVISQEPLEDLQPIGEIDGYINLIFNDKLDEAQIEEISSLQKGAIIYGYFINSTKIKDLLREIEKIKKAIEITPTDDKVAHKELREFQRNRENLLNDYIMLNLFTDSKQVLWFHKGKLQKFTTKRLFNEGLSRICKDIYYAAPDFRNELVNRTKLSSSIFTAKRNFIANLARKWHQIDFGYSSDKFPPEKTIFLTLLKENGLVPNLFNPTQPINLVQGSSFEKLWAFCDDFLEKTKRNRIKVSELVAALQTQPFKLKQGFIEFWLPSYLFIKRDDYALFHEGIYIHTLNEEILELINKRPTEYEIKAFDIEGVRLDIFNSYRTLLNQAEIEDASNTNFIETIKPFFNFYKDLPEYSKHTKRLRKETFVLREAIVKSKDPEKTFFEDFPQALGFTITELQKDKQALEDYVTALQDSIRELRTSYSELVNRLEMFICNEIIYEQLPFELYKKKLQERFINLKKHLLIPAQKTFIMRLDSQIEDKDAWLVSITQALLGKSLTAIKDDDELVLYDKLKNTILELDSLTNLSEENHSETEEVFRLEISSFGSSSKKTVKIPKQKADEIKALELSIKKLLGKDKTLNIAALTNVLKVLIEK